MKVFTSLIFFLLFSSQLFAAEILRVQISESVYYKTELMTDLEVVSVSLCENKVCESSASFTEKTLEALYFKYLKARQKINETESMKGRFEYWLTGENPKEVLARQIRTVNAFDSLVVFLPKSIRENFLTKMKDVISNHKHSLHKDLYKNHMSIFDENVENYVLEDFGYRALRFYYKNKKDLRFMRSFDSYTEYLKFHIELIREEFLILNSELL